MLRFAPRYPGRLFSLIERLDDETLSLAAMARRIGDIAQAEGLIRPSPVHVRRLVAELRELRAEERQVRQAAWDAFTAPMPYSAGNAYDVATAAVRERERIEQRRRRRAR